CSLDSAGPASRRLWRFAQKNGVVSRRSTIAGFFDGRDEAGRPPGLWTLSYAACPETGILPSFDILPPEELSRRGVPLDPRSVSWRPAMAPDVDVEKFLRL